MIKIFNTTYFNKEHYSTHSLGVLHLDFEENRKPVRRIFDDVCEFVYYNDTFKQFGMSIFDIYNNMDYGTYEHFKEFVTNVNRKKVKEMSAMQAEMDQRQNSILKGVKNG